MHGRDFSPTRVGSKTYRTIWYIYCAIMNAASIFCEIGNRTVAHNRVMVMASALVDAIAVF
jgi:hypothetical protein